MATKRRKKPNCGKGQACGYSCIPQYNKDGTKRGCRQPVPEDVAKVNLDAVPAKGKKGGKVKKETLTDLKNKVYSQPDKSVTGALADIDPLTVKLSMADIGKYKKYLGYLRHDRLKDMEDFSKTLENHGVDSETAKVYSFATQLWFSGAYSVLSPGTYKPTKELKPDYDDISLLTGVVATLKLLPSVTMGDKDLQDDIDFGGWDKKTVNRFMNVPNPNEFVAKYKPGSEITEDGLFGTTMREPNKFEHEFSGGTNIRYVIQPKLDGTGKGRFTDGLRTADYKEQGQILYGPGAKFKVGNVTTFKRPSLGLGLYDPYEYDEDQKPIPPDKVTATLKYLDDHKETLKAEFGESYKDKMFEIRDSETGTVRKIKPSEVAQYQKSGQPVHLAYNLDRDYEQTIIELEEITQPNPQRGGRKSS